MALLQKLKRHWFEVVLVVAFGGYLYAARSSGSCPATLVGSWLGGGEKVVGQPAPAWQMPTLDQQLLASGQLEGEVVVLNFWATWCPPCRAELPDFVALQTEWAGKGVQFVGANVEEPSQVEKVQRMADQYELNFPVTFADPAILEAFGGVQYLPTTVVIDAQGRIVKRFEGRVSTDNLRRAVESAQASL
ncbi:MAG: TlpA disulfide reductase family protein [Verrucomicrobiota bacterium JB022]|nr:TlpA disulfide reductase family protein [Verrucomicrobiota bacterium JB022]